MPERHWLDDPALAHLRDDSPYATCSICGRKSWGSPAGSECRMPQPNGSICPGVFGLPSDPLDKTETRDA